MFLPEQIGERLRTQDNRCTNEPIFIVQELKRFYGIDTDYDPKIAWLHDDECVEVDEETANQLGSQYEEDGEDSPDGYRRVGYKEDWEYVQPFFTEAGADLYIKQNGHNHRGKLRTYAQYAHRNHEWIAMRKWLMGLPAPEYRP